MEIREKISFMSIFYLFQVLITIYHLYTYLTHIIALNTVIDELMKHKLGQA